MEFNNIKDGSIALVVWNQDKENDVHVYLGQLTQIEGVFVFKNENKGWTVQIESEKIQEIRKTPEDIREMLLNADYFLNLTIRDLVSNNGDYIPTGMKWH